MSFELGWSPTVQNICALTYSVPLAIKQVVDFDRWNAHCPCLCAIFEQLVSPYPPNREHFCISSINFILAAPCLSCRFFALRYYGWTVVHHLSQRERFFSDSFGSPNEKSAFRGCTPISANRMECRTKHDIFGMQICKCHCCDQEKHLETLFYITSTFQTEFLVDLKRTVLRLSGKVYDGLCVTSCTTNCNYGIIWQIKTIPTRISVVYNNWF